MTDRDHVDGGLLQFEFQAELPVHGLEEVGRRLGGVGLRRQRRRMTVELGIVRRIKQRLDRCSLKKRDRLDSGHIETLAAADVLAADQVVAAHHVALRLGEAGAIAVVGVAPDLGFLAPHEPGKLVFGLLSAVRAGHPVRS
jgi:hypothetical protein